MRRQGLHLKVPSIGTRGKREGEVRDTDGTSGRGVHDTNSGSVKGSRRIGRDALEAEKAGGGGAAALGQVQVDVDAADEDEEEEERDAEDGAGLDLLAGRVHDWWSRRTALGDGDGGDGVAHHWAHWFDKLVRSPDS